MDWDKIKHLFTIKSTYVILLSNIGLILNTSGILDNIQFDKYRVITTALLATCETLGIFGVYNTLPKQSDKTTGKL